ncbi:hypothetical protein [Kitasatospora sp. NPDC087314]|uniref:hypothetical protein n=1 Tax=Kitasatospora sp. NPDC087314 TaxID=3364068 RepID=UPI0038019CDE
MQREFSEPGFPGDAGALRELPRGQSIRPGDPRRQTLGQGFKQRGRSSPAYIRLMGNEADAVVELNRALDRRVAADRPRRRVRPALPAAPAALLQGGLPAAAADEGVRGRGGDVQSITLPGA